MHLATATWKPVSLVYPMESWGLAIEVSGLLRSPGRLLSDQLCSGIVEEVCARGEEETLRVIWLGAQSPWSQQQVQV